MASILPPKCPVCLTIHAPIQVDYGAYQRWVQGEYIDVAFPELSSSQREQIKTGYCDKCWDVIFPPEDDDCPEPFCSFHNYGDQPCPTEDLDASITG